MNKAGCCPPRDATVPALLQVGNAVRLVGPLRSTQQSFGTNKATLTRESNTILTQSTCAVVSGLKQLRTLRWTANPLQDQDRTVITGREDTSTCLESRR